MATMTMKLNDPDAREINHDTIEADPRLARGLGIDETRDITAARR